MGRGTAHGAESRGPFALRRVACRARPHLFAPLGADARQQPVQPAGVHQACRPRGVITTGIVSSRTTVASGWCGTSDGGGTATRLVVHQLHADGVAIAHGGQ